LIPFLYFGSCFSWFSSSLFSFSFLFSFTFFFYFIYFSSSSSFINWASIWKILT
jgi:hypothetical protein